jgi:recombination protein RecT
MSSGTLSEVEHKQPQTLKGLLLSPAVQGQIATALPKHMTPERMVRAALTAMLRTPALAQCDQTSFMQAMLTLSQLGLEPDGGEAD